MEVLDAPFVPLDAASDGRKGKGKKRRESAEAAAGASADAEAKRAKQADAQPQGAGEGEGEAPQAQEEAETEAQAQPFVGLRSVRRTREQQKAREREKRERYAKSGAAAAAGGTRAAAGAGKQRRKKATQSAVVYLGRLPHGFYEEELKGFLQQFGEIEQLRVVRNPKTGRSRHYAYVKFASPEVAAIVAECMNNYLLFGHLLKTHVVDVGRASRDQLFYAPLKNPPEVSQPKPVETWGDYSEQARKQSKKLTATMKRLKAAGIDYEFQPKPKAARPEQGAHKRFSELPDSATAKKGEKGQKQTGKDTKNKGKGQKQEGGKVGKEVKGKGKGKTAGTEEGELEKAEEKVVGAGIEVEEKKGGKEQVGAGGDGGKEGKDGSVGEVTEAAGEAEAAGQGKGTESVVARAKAVAKRLKQEASRFAQALGKDAADAEESGAKEGEEKDAEESEEKEGGKASGSSQEEPWSDEHEEEEELLHEEQDAEEEEDEESEGSEGGEGGDDE